MGRMTVAPQLAGKFLFGFSDGENLLDRVAGAGWSCISAQLGMLYEPMAIVRHNIEQTGFIGTFGNHVLLRLKKDNGGET